MATPTNITNISNVIIITQNPALPKSYFGWKGSYMPDYKQVSVHIMIGNDTFQIPLSSLQVNGQSPTDMSQALTLLNAIFSS